MSMKKSVPVTLLYSMFLQEHSMVSKFLVSIFSGISANDQETHDARLSRVSDLMSILKHS